MTVCPIDAAMTSIRVKGYTKGVKKFISDGLSQLLKPISLELSLCKSVGKLVWGVLQVMSYPSLVCSLKYCKPTGVVRSQKKH